MELIERAREFALEKHEGYTRRHTDAPYFQHLENVVKIVRSVKYDSAMLAAAWLHDVVDNTEVTIVQIFRTFGFDVGYLVYCLSDITVPFGGSESMRYQLQMGHLKNSPPKAKTIKLADVIDNMLEFPKDSINADSYFSEKREQLTNLRGGNTELWKRANSIHIEVTRGKINV